MPEPRKRRKPTRKKLVVFVMDAPNVDASFGLTLGERAPRANERMRLDMLMKWLREKSSAQGCTLYAKIFVNRPIDPDASLKQLGWVMTMKKLGYRVYSKVRTTEDSDVDEDIVECIDYFVRQDRVAEIVLASNDGKRFNAILEILALSDIKVTILGFDQFPSSLTRNELFEYVSYTSIPGIMPA